MKCIPIFIISFAPRVSAFTVGDHRSYRLDCLPQYTRAPLTLYNIYPPAPHQVDAHNVVPCWVASDKQEYGARTIRRKVMDRLPEYLTEFPAVVQHPHTPQLKSKVGGD